MVTEEALILFATLGASGLLVLGVVELMWPAKPRRPVRRARMTAPSIAEREREREQEREPEPVESSVAPTVVERVAPPPTLEVPSFVAPEPPSIVVPPPVATPATPRRSVSAPRAPRAPRTVEWRETAPPPPTEPAVGPAP